MSASPRERMRACACERLCMGMTDGRRCCPVLKWTGRGPLDAIICRTRMMGVGHHVVGCAAPCWRGHHPSHSHFLTSLLSLPLLAGRQTQCTQCAGAGVQQAARSAAQPRPAPAPAPPAPSWPATRGRASHRPGCTCSRQGCRAREGPGGARGGAQGRTVGNNTGMGRAGAVAKGPPGKAGEGGRGGTNTPRWGLCMGRHDHAAKANTGWPATTAFASKYMQWTGPFASFDMSCTAAAGWQALWPRPGPPLALATCMCGRGGAIGPPLPPSAPRCPETPPPHTRHPLEALGGALGDSAGPRVDTEAGGDLHGTAATRGGGGGGRCGLSGRAGVHEPPSPDVWRGYL